MGAMMKRIVFMLVALAAAAGVALRAQAQAPASTVLAAQVKQFAHCNIRCSAGLQACQTRRT